MLVAHPRLLFPDHFRQTTPEARIAAHALICGRTAPSSRRRAEHTSRVPVFVQAVACSFSRGRAGHGEHGTSVEALGAHPYSGSRGARRFTTLPRAAHIHATCRRVFCHYAPGPDRLGEGAS
jgi:hypothetical protein